MAYSSPVTYAAEQTSITICFNLVDWFTILTWRLTVRVITRDVQKTKILFGFGFKKPNHRKI